MRYSAHKEQEKMTSEQRAYHRLKQRKTDKPYYQRYYAIYILVLIIGWTANLLSAVTESSKIYTFYYDFLSSTGFANIATWILVVASVILVEIFHRLIASSYFKDLVENDIHTRDMTPKLIAMLAIALFSTSLSFSGGFDLVKLVKQSPPLLVANTTSTNELQAVYAPIIEDVKSDIQDFRKTREWKGRLSDDSAKKWEAMKENKQDIQLEQATALKNLAVTNQYEMIRTDSLNQQREEQHQAHVNERGYGLGFLSIAAMLVLYFCLWYDEEYQERKAIYLEKIYGKMNHSLSSTPYSLPETSLNESEDIDSFQQHPPLPNDSTPYLNGEKNGLSVSTNTKPIGFFTEAQKLEMVSSQSINQKSSGQAWTDVDRPILTKGSDRYTVEHRYTKGGKEQIVHYTLRMVNSRIGQYEREIEDAIRRELSKDILRNRKTWLIYWKGKKQELLKK